MGVTRALITGHNREYMTISVHGHFRAAETNEFVTVLILTKDGVHEYSGKMRRSTAESQTAEIGLFKGRVKEDRAAKRYDINAPATVENLILESGKMALRSPVKVTLVNLSTTGALLQATPDCFAMDSVVEIKLGITSSLSTMHGKIVRVRSLNTTCAEYGCRLVLAF
ncbi:MAG: PilZ domain-containing protein [Angelakisella sp.]